MIFRLTQKLTKKIKISPSRCLPLDRNPFTDWTAHLFTAQRAQYIIVTNTQSLYSMVMYGRGISDDNQFLQMTLSYMREFMADDSNEFLFRRLIAPRTRDISFSKTGDRRVLGSINDLVFHAKIHLVEGEMSPFDVSLRLNDIPMSFLGYNNPKEAFTAMRLEEDSSNNPIWE